VTFPSPVRSLMYRTLAFATGMPAHFIARSTRKSVTLAGYVMISRR